MAISLPSFAASPSDPTFNQNPYPAYSAMRALGPLFLWQDYGYVCSARYETVNAILRDRRFGRERPADLAPIVPIHLEPFYAFESRSMLEREPPVHTRLRGLVNKAFVSKAVDRLRPRIAAHAHKLIDSFETERRVELITRFATPIPVTVIAELLGIPVDYAPQLLDWSHRMVAMYQFGRSEAQEHDAVAATLAFSVLIRNVIALRRSNPGPDLLSALIAARDNDDRLSEDELITTAILLLNAGHEATVHSIGNAVAAILGSGRDHRKLFSDTKATEATVEEALRYDPPLHLFTRYALADLEIASYGFRRGETVGLLLAAANRDPMRPAAGASGLGHGLSSHPDGANPSIVEQSSNDLDMFEPARPIMPHLSFGAGIHFCVGAPLARVELQIALPILFSRLPKLAIESPPTYRDAYHFHGLDRLDLRF
jgi:cytochrome P450